MRKHQHFSHAAAAALSGRQEAAISIAVGLRVTLAAIPAKLAHKSANTLAVCHTSFTAAAHTGESDLLRQTLARVS